MSNTDLQFKNLTEAQKSYVLSFVLNKVFQDPTKYGLKEDGVLRVGDTINLRDLFIGNNRMEIIATMEKAKQIVMAGSPQEKYILENKTKISNWIKDHPNESIDESKVAEILNYTPKSPKPEIPTTSVAQPQPTPTPTQDLSQEIKEIEEAKAKLAQLESDKQTQTQTQTQTPTPISAPVLERSFASDSKHFISDTKFNQDVEQAFRSEIDGIYGKSGLLGLGKTSGLISKEWQEMARLPANKVIEYYTGDSAKSGLPNEIIEKLAKSKNHGALLGQTAGLMEAANGAVKPFENENMEQFIKRLGGFVMRLHQQNLLKAA